MEHKREKSLFLGINYSLENYIKHYNKKRNKIHLNDHTVCHVNAIITYCVLIQIFLYFSIGICSTSIGKKNPIFFFCNVWHDTSWNVMPISILTFLIQENKILSLNRQVNDLFIFQLNIWRFWITYSKSLLTILWFVYWND